MLELLMYQVYWDPNSTLWWFGFSMRYLFDLVSDRLFVALNNMQLEVLNNKLLFILVLLCQTAGNYYPLMSVMAGGNGSHLLGIALATTFFKNKFTSKMRWESGRVCYIVGLSFILQKVLFHLLLLTLLELSQLV